MISKPVRALAIIGGNVLLPLAAQAHPGHDGHDFTWELGHLAEYPTATLGWALVIVSVIGAVRWIILRRQPTPSFPDKS